MKFLRVSSLLIALAGIVLGSAAEETTLVLANESFRVEIDRHHGALLDVSPRQLRVPGALKAARSGFTCRRPRPASLRMAARRRWFGLGSSTSPGSPRPINSPPRSRSTARRFESKPRSPTARRTPSRPSPSRSGQPKSAFSRGFHLPPTKTRNGPITLYLISAGAAAPTCPALPPDHSPDHGRRHRLRRP